MKVKKQKYSKKKIIRRRRKLSITFYGLSKLYKRAEREIIKKSSFKIKKEWLIQNPIHTLFIFDWKRWSLITEPSLSLNLNKSIVKKNQNRIKFNKKFYIFRYFFDETFNIFINKIKYIHKQWLASLQIFKWIYRFLPRTFIKKLTRNLDKITPAKKHFFIFFNDLFHYFCIFLCRLQFMPTISTAILSIKTNWFTINLFNNNNPITKIKNYDFITLVPQLKKFGIYKWFCRFFNSLFFHVQRFLHYNKYFHSRKNNVLIGFNFKKLTHLFFIEDKPHNLFSLHVYTTLMLHKQL